VVVSRWSIIELFVVLNLSCSMTVEFHREQGVMVVTVGANYHSGNGQLNYLLSSHMS
jgi:hypothetical protein